jgi:hypothetical protein
MNQSDPAGDPVLEPLSFEYRSPGDGRDDDTAAMPPIRSACDHGNDPTTCPLDPCKANREAAQSPGRM